MSTSFGASSRILPGAALRGADHRPLVCAASLQGSGYLPVRSVSVDVASVLQLAGAAPLPPRPHPSIRRPCCLPRPWTAGTQLLPLWLLPSRCPQAHSQTNSSRDLPKSNRRTSLLKPPLPGALRVQARVLRVPCKVTSLPVTLSPAPFLCLLCSSHIRCPGSAHTGTHEPRAGLRGLLLPHPGSLLPQELRRFLPRCHIRALSETFPAPCFSISLAMSDILPHLCFCSFCLCHRI